MDRRSFFRAFAGAPAITAAAIAAPAKPEPARAIAQIPTCECGYWFMVTMSHSDGMRPKDDPRPARRFMACPNPRCRRYNVAYALPTVELAEADPEFVAAIKRENEKRLKEDERQRHMEYERQRHMVYVKARKAGYSARELDDSVWPGKVNAAQDPPLDSDHLHQALARWHAAVERAR